MRQSEAEVRHSVGARRLFRFISEGWGYGVSGRCEKMKQCDQAAIEGLGIPSMVLMERAALAVTEEILKARPQPHRCLSYVVQEIMVVTVCNCKTAGRTEDCC